MSIVACEPLPGSRLVVDSIVSGSMRLFGSWMRLSAGAGNGSRDDDGIDVRPDDPDNPLGGGSPTRPDDPDEPLGSGTPTRPDDPEGPPGGGVGVARPDGGGVDDRVEPGPKVASSRATV
jgi:hypothetical protein